MELVETGGKELFCVSLLIVGGENDWRFFACDSARARFCRGEGVANFELIKPDPEFALDGDCSR